MCTRRARARPKAGSRSESPWACSAPLCAASPCPTPRRGCAPPLWGSGGLSRSLGAGWGTVMLRIVVPNMPTAILNASLLSASLVLGEYTFANLLNYENLQVAIQYVSLVSAGTSIAVAVASLLFAFVLLMILSFVGRLQLRVSPGQRA